MVKLALEGGPPVRSTANYLVFGMPVFEEAEINEVVDSFQRRWIGTGPKVQIFEEDFAGFTGA